MSKRGKRLFEKLNDMAAPPEVAGLDTLKKGRSKALVDERNNQLIHRYYYHAHIRCLKYELVLAALQKDFCLSATTVTALIASRSDDAQSLFKAKPTTAHLIKKYPHFNWVA